MSFLDGIKDNTGSENLIAKCVDMEQIYSLNNPAMVAPMSFIKMYYNTRHLYVFALIRMD